MPLIIAVPMKAPRQAARAAESSDVSCGFGCAGVRPNIIDDQPLFL
jgi:hypothetical protein